MTDSAAADISRAEMLINQALAASPRNPFAHFVKGQIRRQQGRYEEATTEYESVLASNRNSRRDWARRHRRLAEARRAAVTIVFKYRLQPEVRVYPRAAPCSKPLMSPACARPGCRMNEFGQS
jgi:predicted Zn-dependent protease